ncbi:MAG: sodium-dependent transporter [Candidatus Anstonellales archaeon]
MSTKDRWSGSLEFIIAAIGSAVGIGNIWRFPYIMGQNGMLAFLVPYTVCLIVIGVPLLMLEIGAGLYFRVSYLEVLKKIGFPQSLGIFTLLVVFFILSYYVVITSWMLFYAFGFFTGLDVNFGIISGSYISVPFFLATIFLLYVVMSLGIKKGIEPAVMVFVPILALLLVVITAYMLIMMPQTIEKTLEKIELDMEYFMSPRTWLFASAQVVFSLSIGMGLMLTYGAYVKDRLDLKKSALTICLGDLTVSLLSVFIIFPLAFLSGTSIEEGALLSMEALPVIFGMMPFGKFVGGIFFLLVFIAAFTSAISMAEMGIHSFDSKLKLSRQKAVEYFLLALLLVSSVVLLSYSPLNLSLFGKPILDLFDVIFGTMLSPLSAFLVLVALAHYWDIKRFLLLAGIMNRTLSRILEYILKWVSPAILILLFSYGITH